MWPSYGLLVAQIWQTGVDHPNAIILQYVGQSKVLNLGRIWARIKINVAQIWASSALFGLFMADIGPSFGLLVAQIGQTGADRASVGWTKKQSSLAECKLLEAHKSEELNLGKGVQSQRWFCRQTLMPWILCEQLLVASENW